MNNGRGRGSTPAGRALMSSVLVAVIGLSGCAGSDAQVVRATDSSAIPPAAGSIAAGSNTAGSTTAGSSTDNADEVARQVTEYLDAQGSYFNPVQSVLADVDGRELVAYYGPDSGPDVAHNVYSVTKSVISMLVGIAVGEGLIGSVDQTVAELLPAHGLTMAPGVGAVTLGQLLTMTGGITDEAVLDVDPNGIDESSPRYTADADWIAVTLATPLAQPAGAGFLYSNLGSHLLSAILVQATGRPVLEYAREKLFHPLGVSTEPADQPTYPSVNLREYDSRPAFGWSTDPQGLNLGASDLKLTAPDMIKLGRLYLQEGQWEGRQLVPEEWVRESTSTQVANEEQAIYGYPYGYLWWLPSTDDHPGFAALGWAGQLIQVIPDLNLVVAVSTTNGPAGYSDPSALVDLIVPIIAGE